MEFPGLITIKPEQTDLVDVAARIIGVSFLEEGWTSTYLSAIGGDEAFDRKQEVSRAMIREEVVVGAPYGCAFILPDQAGAAMGFLGSEMTASGTTWPAIEEEAHARVAKMLTPDEEAVLLRRMQQDGDAEAREKLIEHNLRLVAHIVKKYYAVSTEQDDLLSIGTIGLIKAVNTFKADKNIRLATYASKCIQNELLMYFRQKRKSAGELSLSDTLESDGDGNALALQDIICCEDSGLSAVEEQDRYHAMHRALAGCLSPREREIIRLRYGIGLASPLPQREIAARLGISRSYVSRIEKRALEKLREALEREGRPP